MSSPDLDIDHREPHVDPFESPDRCEKPHMSEAQIAKCELDQALRRLDIDLAHTPGRNPSAEVDAIRPALRETVARELATAEAVGLSANAQRGLALNTEGLNRTEQHGRHTSAAEGLIEQQTKAMRTLAEAVHAFVDAAGPRFHTAYAHSVQRELSLPDARARLEAAIADLRAVNADMAKFVLDHAVDPSRGRAAQVSSSTVAIAVDREHHVTLYLGREDTGTVSVTLPSGDRVDVTVHDHNAVLEWDARATGDIRLDKDGSGSVSARSEHFGFTAEKPLPVTQHYERTEQKMQREGGWRVEGGPSFTLGPFQVRGLQLGTVEVDLKGGLDQRNSDMDKRSVIDRTRVEPTSRKDSFTFDVVRVNPPITILEPDRKKR